MEYIKEDEKRVVIAICGGSGSGKSTCSLSISEGLVGDEPEDIVYLIDTENRSSIYRSQFNFECIPMNPPYNYSNFIGIIEYLKKKVTRKSVIIFDTFSDFWSGDGGVLDQVDKCGKSSIHSWGKPKKGNRNCLDKLLSLNTHVIINLFARQKMTMGKDENNKMVVTKDTFLTAEQDHALTRKCDMRICLNLESPGTFTIEKVCAPLIEAVLLRDSDEEITYELGEHIRELLESNSIAVTRRGKNILELAREACRDGLDAYRGHFTSLKGREQRFISKTMKHQEFIKISKQYDVDREKKEKVVLKDGEYVNFTKEQWKSIEPLERSESSVIPIESYRDDKEADQYDEMDYTPDVEMEREELA